MKYSELKKKKKDLEKKVHDLEKMADGIKQDEDRLEVELIEMKSEKEREHERYLELSTKYALGQAKMASL